VVLSLYPNKNYYFYLIFSYSISKYLAEFITIVEQQEPLGFGHAIHCARRYLFYFILFISFHIILFCFDLFYFSLFFLLFPCLHYTPDISIMNTLWCFLETMCTTIQSRITLVRETFYKLLITLEDQLQV
jgi:hypothetical protein